MALTQAFRAGYEGRAGWCITFRFDADVIRALKERVPWADRSWDGETKTWWVSAEFEDVLLKLLPDFEVYLRQGALPGMEA